MPYVVEVLENGQRSFVRSDTSYASTFDQALVHYTLGHAREALYRVVGTRYARLLSLPGWFVELPPPPPEDPPNRFETREQFSPPKYVTRGIVGDFGVSRLVEKAWHFTTKGDAEGVAEHYKWEQAFVQPFAQEPPSWAFHDRRVQKIGVPGIFGKITAVYNGQVMVIADHDGTFSAYPIDLFTEIFEPEVPSRFERG